MPKHAPRSSTRLVPSTSAAVLLGVGLLTGCDGLPRMEADPMPRNMGWGDTQRAATFGEGGTGMRFTRTASDEERDRMAQAMSAAERGELETAIAEFEAIIAENPTLTTAYLGAGDLYLETGDYNNAEARFSRAAQLEPRNFDAQYKHGVVLQIMKRTLEAVRAYLRALSIEPNNAEANLNLASAYLDLGEAEQALPYARRAVELDPQSGAARANLGSTYAAMNRHQQAVVEYRQASELMELTPELLLNLADSLGQTGANEEMAATLDSLVRIQPSPEAYERLGTACFRLRRYDAALGAFRAAVNLDANHYPAWNGIAVSRLNDYLWSNETDEPARRDALSALRKSLQIEPNQPRIVELLRRFG